MSIAVEFEDGNSSHHILPMLASSLCVSLLIRRNVINMDGIKVLVLGISLDISDQNIGTSPGMVEFDRG